MVDTCCYRLRIKLAGTARIPSLQSGRAISRKCWKTQTQIAIDRHAIAVHKDRNRTWNGSNFWAKPHHVLWSYSNNTFIARLAMNLQRDQAVSDRKTVRQPKSHLSKAGVRHGTHIFRGNVVEL